MPDWTDDLSSLTRALGSRVRGAARHLARAVTGTNPYEIVPYRGHGTSTRLYVHGRVLEGQTVTPAAEVDSTWRNLLDTWKRLEADPLPHARVRARVGAVEHEIVADDEGFFATWLTLSAPLPADRLWHPVELELLGPLRPQDVGVRATALCLVPPPGAAYAVISDLDDTVIQSHVTNFLRAARTLLLDNARTRLPFPGVAAFYQALHAGTGGVQNPIYYVSSSPWNLYSLLTEFLDLQGIPIGPLMLRDWDIDRRMIARDRHHSHKGELIREIIALNPTLSFILIGDSGQQDPEIYQSIVEEFPDRIHAIYIRNIERDPLRIAAVMALAEKVRAARSSLVLADDTLAAARHAVEHGWIPASALPAIGEEKRADEGVTAEKAPAPGTPTPEDKTPTVVVDDKH
jgi:phosphatidate phosphatase APP1